MASKKIKDVQTKLNKMHKDVKILKRSALNLNKGNQKSESIINDYAHVILTLTYLRTHKKSIPYALHLTHSQYQNCVKHVVHRLKTHDYEIKK